MKWTDSIAGQVQIELIRSFQKVLHRTHLRIRQKVHRHNHVVLCHLQIKREEGQKLTSASCCRSQNQCPHCPSVPVFERVKHCHHENNKHDPPLQIQAVMYLFEHFDVSFDVNSRGNDGVGISRSTHPNSISSKIARSGSIRRSRRMQDSQLRRTKPPLCRLLASLRECGTSAAPEKPSRIRATFRAIAKSAIRHAGAQRIERRVVVSSRSIN